MILCCDFNPKLTRKFYAKDFFKNRMNVAESTRVYPSGMGVDMAVFAQMLGENVKLFFLEGMETGKIIASHLHMIGIDSCSVTIKDENVEHIVIKQNHNKTEIATSLPRITMEDKNDILAAFCKEAELKKVVCLPKIDHPMLALDISEKLIHYCYQNNVKVITTVSHISDLKGSRPFLLLLGKEQLEKQVPIGNTTQVIKEGKLLLDSGIGMLVVVSVKGAVIMTKEKNYYASFQHYQGNIEKINRELMLMGFAMGIERDYNFDTTIKFGMSCGIWENFKKFRQVDMGEMKTFMNNISVEEL